MSDEDRMNLLRKKAMEGMARTNAKCPTCGAQTFERREDGVHLFNSDGTVQSRAAKLNPKTGMYE